MIRSHRNRATLFILIGVALSFVGYFSPVELAARVVIRTVAFLAMGIGGYHYAKGKGHSGAYGLLGLFGLIGLLVLVVLKDRHPRSEEATAEVFD